VAAFPTFAAPDAHTIEAAKREGRVVVAGPPVQVHRETILKFQEAYPGIKVDFNGSPPHIREARMAAERNAGKFLVDVVVGGTSSSLYENEVRLGWYDDIKAAIVDPEIMNDGNWIGGFSAGLMDRQKRHVYAFTGERAGGLFINKDLIRENFSYQSLLDAKWRGKIAALDPRTRGIGNATVQQFIANLGKSATCRLLETQQLILSETPKQLVDWAARGAYPILIGIDAATLSSYQASGLAKNVVVVEDPKRAVVSKWGNVQLVNRAPNPNAAKLFITWLLSKEVQAEWARSANVNSRRADVPVVNPAFAVSADTWVNGYNISAEEQSADSGEAMKLSQSCLKLTRKN
jgi:iron(III) transport system substrate-binding protein